MSNPKVIPMIPGGGSMRSLLDQGVDAVEIIAAQAGHAKSVMGIARASKVEAQGESNRVLPNRASFEAQPKKEERRKGFYDGAQVIHAPSHQRVSVIKTNVARTKVGEPVHLCKTGRGDEVKIPERNLRSMD